MACAWFIIVYECGSGRRFRSQVTSLITTDMKKDHLTTSFYMIT